MRGAGPRRGLSSHSDLPLVLHTRARHGITFDGGVRGRHSTVGGDVAKFAAVGRQHVTRAVAQVGTGQYDGLATTRGRWQRRRDTGDDGRRVAGSDRGGHALAVDGERPQQASADALHGGARDLNVCTRSHSTVGGSHGVCHGTLCGLVRGSNNCGRHRVDEPEVGAPERDRVAARSRERQRRDGVDGQVIHVADIHDHEDGVEQRLGGELAQCVRQAVCHLDGEVVPLHRLVVQGLRHTEHAAVHGERGYVNRPEHAVAVRVGGTERVHCRPHRRVLVRVNLGGRWCEHGCLANIHHAHIHTVRGCEAIRVRGTQRQVVPQLAFVVKLLAVGDCQRKRLGLAGRGSHGEGAIVVAADDLERQHVGVAAADVWVLTSNACCDHRASRRKLRH